MRPNEEIDYYEIKSKITTNREDDFKYNIISSGRWTSSVLEDIELTVKRSLIQVSCISLNIEQQKLLPFDWLDFTQSHLHHNIYEY